MGKLLCINPPKPGCFPDMTVLEAIQKSTEFLAKRGVEPPRLQAELLLAHVLKLPRMKLYLNFERVLTVPETDALRELVRRRGTREPLQHITGSVSFCGYEMTVNRAVLVPRPETELLAEAGWQMLTGLNRPATALDWCTGSGCLAIALAAKHPAVQVTATDLSPEALAVAEKNAAANGVAERIRFLAGDGFAALAQVAEPEGRQFDLIVTNPPYIPSAEIAELEPEVREFDPRLALDGGGDGLDFYRRLAVEAGEYLRPDGRLMAEFGDGQAPAVKKMLEDEKWIVEAVRADYSQRDRFLIARR